MKRIYLLSFIGILTSLSTLNARADFTPPKDGKLTEKQVANYIAVFKEQMDTLKAAGKASGDSGAANMAILMHASEKLDASITAHGFSKDEYNWVSEQVNKLWPIAFLQKEWNEKSKPEMEKQIKTKEADSADAKAKIAVYEPALKDGKRVITKEQRDALVVSATSDRDAIAAEVKTDQEAIKPISDEIAQHEKDAGDAEALAKNPPADVAADDKNAYIDGKKNEAQAAMDAARDARDRLKEAQKNLDDAKARLAIVNGKVEHPELPVTDDDKAAVKSENEQAIAAAKQAIADDDQAIALLKETLAAGPIGANGNGKDKPDPDNLALVQKHLSEYLEATGVKTDAK